MNSSTKTQEEVIIELLQERHLNYLGKSKDQIKDNPFWQNTEPISKMEYSEWVEYGVNNLMSLTGCNRNKAEIDMSWIEAKYGIKVK